jgi:hypothetical protein
MPPVFTADLPNNFEPISADDIPAESGVTLKDYLEIQGDQYLKMTTDEIKKSMIGKTAKEKIQDTHAVDVEEKINEVEMSCAVEKRDAEKPESGVDSESGAEDSDQIKYRG